MSARASVLSLEKVARVGYDAHASALQVFHGARVGPWKVVHSNVRDLWLEAAKLVASNPRTTDRDLFEMWRERATLFGLSESRASAWEDLDDDRRLPWRVMAAAMRATLPEKLAKFGT